MVFSDPFDVWNHLRDDTTFKTYADERLAMLYLQDPDNFDMLIKVFDVILDPLFKLEDITFKSVWDIFDYISDYRRRATPARGFNELVHIAPQETHAYSVPLLAVSLFVDRMVEDRVQMGFLADDNNWRDAYESNVEDFHAMSLVHPTWTPIARRAFQCRVVVPHYQIDSFLLSPLCGPWVTEMVVHWTINNGFEGAASSDVGLFQALLERTPRLRSLAFITDLYRHGKRREVDRASSQLSRCLKVISNMVPNLENLWLKHSWHWQGDLPASENMMVGFTTSLRTCDGVDSLSRLLSNLRSLRFFSMRSWNTIEQVHIERHPKLQTVEIHNKPQYYNSEFRDPIKSLYLSRAPGGEFIKVSDASCRTMVLKRLAVSELSSLSKLQVERGRVNDLAKVLHHCTSLVHLKLSDLDYHRSAIITELFPSHTLGSQIRKFCGYIRSLPRLRRLVLSDYRLCFSRLQDLIKSFNHSEFTPPDEQEGRTTPLIELCKERGIEFVLESREGSIRVC